MASTSWAFRVIILVSPAHVNNVIRNPSRTTPFPCRSLFGYNSPYTSSFSTDTSCERLNRHVEGRRLDGQHLCSTLPVDIVSRRCKLSDVHADHRQR